VILNPAPARALPPDLLARVSLLTPNEGEARLLVANAGTAALATVADTEPGEDDAAKGDAASVETNGVAALAAGLLASGVGVVVITLGAAGALMATPDGIEHQTGFPVRAVDTVAAGDCFTGALAVEIASGRALRDAVQFANAAAAVSVTRPGAQPALPSRPEVDALLAAARKRG
jgi:ribokinase